MENPGADILVTNTLQANPISPDRHNHRKNPYEITYKAVKILKDIPEMKYVGGCIGPTTGEYRVWAMDPTNAYTADEFYAACKEQVRAFKDAGVDPVICKTFFLFPELKAALRASKDHDMVRAVSPAFNYVEKPDNFATTYGAKIDDLISLNDADIIGFNCGSVTPCSPKTGPLDMLESPEIGKEDSDERHAVQSGEDHRHFEGG